MKILRFDGAASSSLKDIHHEIGLHLLLSTLVGLCSVCVFCLVTESDLIILVCHVLASRYFFPLYISV